MKFTRALVAIGCFLSFAPGANAFTVGVLAAPGQTRIDFSKKTYISVSGYGKEMHNGFYMAAVTRAKQMQASYPDAQIVLMRSLDNGHYDWGDRDYDEVSDEEGLRMDRKELTDMGFTIARNNDEDMNNEEFLTYVKRFRKIAGIDVYSHFAAYNGARTGLGNRAGLRFVNDDEEELDVLRGHFVRGAYIALHGCNSGWVNAPKVSRYLRIPVMGSLTSMDLQVLADDGKWYFDDDRWPWAPGTHKARQISVAEDRSISCNESGCSRMKGINTVYGGHAGTVEGGQPFYKFFCGYAGTEGDSDCFKTMALHMMGSPSVRPLSINSSVEEFKEVVLDWLCPIDSQGHGETLRASCIEAILSAEALGTEIYSPFSGNPTACNMRKCNAEVERNTFLFLWDAGGDVHSPPNPDDKTIIQEYKRYVRGFELLKNDPSFMN